MAEENKEELQAQENATEAATTEETPKAEAPVEEVAKEEKPAEKEPKAEKVEETPVEAPIDWDELDSGGFGEEYSDAQRKEMEAMYEGTLNSITEKEVISGSVVGITDRDVIVNIGFKSDGLVALSEFRDRPELKAGDEVEVYVEEQENANGQLILSRRKAKIVKAWENIQKALDEDLVIDGMVKRRTKGGLIVDIYGVEAFLPGSQIDVKPIRDFDVFVNKKMEVKVVKINYSNDSCFVQSGCD